MLYEVITYWEIRLNEFKLAIELFNAIGWESASEEFGVGIFDRLFQCVMILDGIISDSLTEKYLGEKVRWIRGRILWWLDMERGGTGESVAAQRDIKYLLKIHPQDNLIKMYSGEKIDLPDRITSYNVCYTKLLRHLMRKFSMLIVMRLLI